MPPACRAAAINTVADVFKDPQVKARGMLKHVPHPSGCRRAAGVHARCASPMRRCQTQAAPPLLGQHSDDILAELGYGAADIAALRTARSRSDGDEAALVSQVALRAQGDDLRPRAGPAAERLELVRSVAAMLKPNERLMQDNPLSKIPTLVLEDGFTLFDSVVICEYLNDAGAAARCSPSRAPTSGRRCAGTRSATACSMR